MSLASTIGLRYTKAKRDNQFVSFISLASVIGIALGVIVLITVLSVINGYEEGMRDRYLGMISHVTVSGEDWNLPHWQSRKKEVMQNKNVVAAAPFIEKQVMLKEGDKVKAVILQSILPNEERSVGTVSQFVSNEKGLNNLKAGEFKIILGVTLAKELGVEIGDSITLLSPRKESFALDENGAQVSQDQTPILRDFTIAATFNMDMHEYDAYFAYIHMHDAQELFEMDKNVTGLRVQIKDIFKANEVSNTIAENSKEAYVISNWTLRLSNVFKGIQLQKTMLFLVLVLIIGVAAFNLVSTLIMVVTEKQSDIAILRTLGMSQGQVMRIFIVQGSVLGLIGTIIGVIVGLLIAFNITDIVNWLEQLLNVSFLKASVHQITHIDAKIEAFDVLLIAVSAFFLTILATLFPAWKASRVHPAEALRYD